ncbi:MAG: hypothetical protein HYU02_02120, partial [Thaumarchaeota archaeon]|nr:hypothetical protein [Nitrososphaerota archaeon]
MKEPIILQKLQENAPLFARFILGFSPTEYQERILNDNKRWVAVRIARQGGKTVGVLGVRAIHFLSMHPRITVLIVAPSFRQAMIVRNKMEPLFMAIPKPVRKLIFKKIQQTQVFTNHGSDMYYLPNSPDLIRGYTAWAIFVDEVAMFRDADYLFENVLMPMTNTTRQKGFGFIYGMSTPKGKKSYFYEICRGRKSRNWSQHHYTWRDVLKAGLVDQQTIDQYREDYDPHRFTMEYEAEFVEDIDSWLPYDLIISCIEGSEKRKWDYLSFEEEQSGEFFGGVDLGKHQDHSVILVFRREGEVFNLIHKKKFPLDTSYASVIGYMKVLNERWNSFSKWFVDATGVGDYVVEEINNLGLNVEGITFTLPRKEELAMNMKEL